MQKRDFETYQKRFQDFEILPKFSETHVFRGTIRHPFGNSKISQIIDTQKITHIDNRLSGLFQLAIFSLQFADFLLQSPILHF